MSVSLILIILQLQPELPVCHITRLIKAELPRSNAALFAKIRKFMTHGKDHLTRETSRCRRGNKCVYGFPQPITLETYVDDDGRVHYRRPTDEDRWIAPHIPELINELDCHIYVDVVFTVSVFTYLYKYLYKGPDHTHYRVRSQDDGPIDEIRDYVEGRYLSAHEAAWRILGFHITSKTPAVACLPVHLPGENIARFTGGAESHNNSTSLLIRYFNRPRAALFGAYTYCDYFKDYVLYKWEPGEPLHHNEFLELPIAGCVRHKVSPRQVGAKVARLRMVSPTAGELFYLRTLLAHRAATSFVALRTVDGTVHDSFHEAATHFGLFSNENEGQYAIADAAASFCTPHQLRFLFSRIIVEGYPARPIWDAFSTHLSQDFILRMRSSERGMDRALEAISELVHDGGRSLNEYGLPEPLHRSPEVVAEHETYLPRTAELLDRAEILEHEMTDEQLSVFHTILESVSEFIVHGRRSPRPFFLEGKPGRGKTFVVNAVCNRLRGERFIVLVVGLSALAATLYEGGRTAHNLFKIPVLEVRVKPHAQSGSTSSPRSE